MYSVGVRPSYKTGFAQWPGMSEYPQLWKGLVGDWDMSLGQTGNKVFDLSGNGYEASFAGDTFWTSGKYGFALSLDGVGDYAETAKTINMVSLNAMTIVGSCIREAGVDHMAICGTNDGFFFTFQGGKLWFWGDKNQTVGESQLNVYTDGVRYNFAVTHKDLGGAGVPGITKFYLNGADVSNINSDSLAETTGEVIRLGTWRTALYSFKGIIDYIMIYNRALSASEIALLYQLRKRMA